MSERERTKIDNVTVFRREMKKRVLRKLKLVKKTAAAAAAQGRKHK
jgi:hypothetical protein